MHKTTIYIPEDLQHDIETLAKHEKRSKADFIRHALRTYIDQKPKRVPKSIGMGEDGTLAAEGIDDWLKENWSKDLSVDKP